MATFEPVDYDPFGGGRAPIPQHGRALLDAIAGSESPGYNVTYGGGTFDDFTDHPRKAVPIRSGPNAGKTSSAAGRYQFLGSTWDEVKNEAGLPDFSPESQDIGAWHLAQKTYKTKTGRDLERDLESAKGNPHAVAGIGKMLSGTWTSLPGGIEPNSQTRAFAERYERSANPPAGNPTEFTAQRRVQPKFEPVDYDPFAAPQGAERPPDPLRDQADNGGRFTDNPGQSFRTAREGESELAQVPKGFTDRLAEMWENPPRDRLSMIRMAKDIYTAARTIGEAAAGNVPVYDEYGDINPNVLGSAVTVAGAAPMRSAPGGVLAAPIAPKVTERVVTEAAKVPTTEAIKVAAKAGFKDPAIKDLEIAPRALKDFAGIVQGKLNEAGFDDVLATKAFGILKKLESAPDGAIVTGANLQTLRRTFGKAAKSPDETERAAAVAIINAIDEFVPTIAARDILSGDPAAAAKAWGLARENYNVAMRSEDIAKAVLGAADQTGSTGAGANIDNVTRQHFKTILKSEKRQRGFTDEEIDMMRGIVRGTTWGNAMRLVGKAAPTGIVSAGLGVAGGMQVGGGIGAVVVPIAGIIGKKLGDRSTATQVAKLDELIRSRAPLAKAMEDTATKIVTVKESGQNARTMSALSLSARNLAANLKDAGINLSPTEIMRALQGPIAGRAEDDQPN